MTDATEERLRACWSRSDRIFGLVEPGALHERPIALRHPLIFYLGHLPAFAWNQVCRGVLGKPPFRADFDALFERGIDPMGVDSHEPSTDWPPVDEVLEYRDRVREEVVSAIGPVAERDRVFSVAIEHELMHQETLQYILQQLPAGLKRRPDPMPPYRFDGAAEPGAVEVGRGEVVLGADPDAIPFGWDNEFPELSVEVDDFTIDRTPVRHREFVEFFNDGGYRRPGLWRDEDWQWRRRVGLEHPVFWSCEYGGIAVRTLFDDLPLEQVADWPVFVSHAEAEAYCRWRGGRLATEAELHRAAYTTPDGGLRAHPWGDEAPAEGHGNFDFRHWAPTPVGAFPEGDSAWGVADLVGNGWEWTATVFAPFPGFAPTIPTYPGYSTDFFDGLHLVMLGASWATPAGLIRRSFRNWFQRHYPYMFAKFRCVYP
ncbi:MAG: SUMF1/EgtB/PvdO family nonheme iron enzyme [Thermoanaerobaculales bacterium]|jgi:ergothioneine biosynthesis protein EgtB|nr:SUMF1/EgtB/PvdO family nonheme iron enzyme [Thermoanaerobaculales bacterium]